MEFKGKTALITGASSGIGKEFANQLGQLGANLVITARNQAALERVAAEIKGKNPKINIDVISCDLSQTDGAQQLYVEVEQRKLAVDYLVNNAGFGSFGALHASKLEVYQQMIQLNMTSLTELTYLFLPRMKENNEGGIINVASTASFQPLPYQAVYGATKAYVLNFSEALSGELLDSQVHAMALCPGVTASNFMQTANADSSKMSFKSASDVVKIALKGFGKRRGYVVTGCQNYLMSLVPRILSRMQIIKVVAKMFRDQSIPAASE